MTIAKKYEGVVAERDAALAREAALREELSEVKRHVKNADMVFDLLRIACDATGETTALVYSKLGDMLNASAERDALQQRLTVAEKRASVLESAAREMIRIAGIANQGSNAYNRAIINLNAALKPAEGEGS